MSKIYNIYCDESGHLENDQLNVMVLGAIWCPLDKTREIAISLREIKENHGLSRKFEIKWTKVSPAKLKFYLDVLIYFFKEDDLHFRALVVPDKSVLRHNDFGQIHDDWYYKMYFDLLKIIISPSDKYRIYLDIKDSRSAHKIEKLHKVLSNNMYDFSREIIQCIQTVRSDEVEQLQLADLLIGAVSYANREIITSSAKVEIVQSIRKLSGYNLLQSTLFRETKFNIFRWHARKK